MGLPPLLVRAAVEDMRTAQVTAEYMAGLHHVKGYPFLISSWEDRGGEHTSYTAYSGNEVGSADWVRYSVSPVTK
jgi:hypothetical protein